MLETILRRYRDQGHLIVDGREIPVQYEIAVSGNANARRANGVITGLDVADHMGLLTSQKLVALRLISGEIVETVFLGGQMSGPAKIAINTPMPGFD